MKWLRRLKNQTRKVSTLWRGVWPLLSGHWSFGAKPWQLEELAWEQGMTVVWSAWHEGVVYEVRQLEETMRLYANGVQHSEFNATRMVTGSVWDLLWLPAFMAAEGSIKRVLILGLGGGSSIPPLRHFFDPDEIVAVELDPFHLEVACEQFKVTEMGVEAHCADAVEWVKNYRGPAFDLVIEDLFSPANVTVTRAVPAKKRWLKQLEELVSPKGVLVMNFGDEFEFKASDASTKPQGFASGLRLSTPDCHNAVIAWSRQSAGSKSLLRRIKQWQELALEMDLGRLRYTSRELF